MRTFEYTGYDRQGHAAKGLIEAFDLKDAREKLSHKGILARQVNPAGQLILRWWKRGGRVFTLETRAMVYRELAAVLSAGIPLANALAIMIDSPELGENRPLLAGIRDRVREGVSFADALAAASPHVTPFEKSAVETGERAGSLEVVLESIAMYLEDRQRLRERIQTALIYPVIIILLSAIIGILMLGYMLPAFQSLFAEAGLEVPSITRWTMGMGRIAIWLAIFMVPTVLLGLLWCGRRVRSDREFRVKLDRLIFKLPLIGRAYTALVGLRFSRTLSVLLKSGVSLIEGMHMAGRSTGSPWIDVLMEKEVEKVRHGGGFPESIAEIPPLSESLPAWIRAGEASGDLTGMLENSGARFQRQWERMLSRFIALIEPVLIIIIGLFVLMLALSILLPILTLNQTLG